MINLHDILRKRLLESKGLLEIPRLIDYASALAKIVDMMLPFFELMLNRILMGRFRYGEFDERYRDMTDDMERCLRMYRKTRNTEYLVDMANYAWIEFRFGSHTDKHWASVDDGEHSKQ